MSYENSEEGFFPFVEDQGPPSIDDFDFGIFFRDSFKEDLWRSQQVKKNLALLAPSALQALQISLSLPVDPKNNLVRLKAAEFVLDKLSVETELPKLSMIISRSEESKKIYNMQVKAGQEFQDQAPEVLITREQAIEFAREALEAQKEIDAFKADVRETKELERQEHQRAAKAFLSAPKGA